MGARTEEEMEMEEENGRGLRGTGADEVVQARRREDTTRVRTLYGYGQKSCGGYKGT